MEQIDRYIEKYDKDLVFFQSEEPDLENENYVERLKVEKEILMAIKNKTIKDNGESLTLKLREVWDNGLEIWKEMLDNGIIDLHDYHFYMTNGFKQLNDWNCMILTLTLK